MTGGSRAWTQCLRTNYEANLRPVCPHEIRRFRGGIMLQRAFFGVLSLSAMVAYDIFSHPL